MSFQIATTAFSSGGTIPKNYTCDGPDLSPPLSWKEPPAGTRSFALIADDPDAPAGTWVHWVLYNAPSTAKELPEAVKKDEQLADVNPAGAQRLSQNRIRRSVPSTRQATPLLLQAVCARQ